MGEAQKEKKGEERDQRIEGVVARRREEQCERRGGEIREKELMDFLSE